MFFEMYASYHAAIVFLSWRVWHWMVLQWYWSDGIEWYWNGIEVMVLNGIELPKKTPETRWTSVWEAKTPPTAIISLAVMCDHHQKPFQWVLGRPFDNELTRTCLTRTLGGCDRELDVYVTITSGGWVVDWSSVRGGGKSDQKRGGVELITASYLLLHLPDNIEPLLAKWKHWYQMGGQNRSQNPKQNDSNKLQMQLQFVWDLFLFVALITIDHDACVDCDTLLKSICVELTTMRDNCRW